MRLTRDQIGNLKNMLLSTRDEEINCNEFLDHVVELAERQLEGIPVAKGLESVAHHLTLCVECREEYDALLKVLKTEGN